MCISPQNKDKAKELLKELGEDDARAVAQVILGLVGKTYEESLKE